MIYKGKTIEVNKLDLPAGIFGATACNEAEAKYQVYINGSVAGIVQRHTLGHELAHIFLGHFESDLPLWAKEREAEEKAWDYYRAYKAGLLDQ